MVGRLNNGKEEQDKLQIKNYKTPDTARVGRFSEEFEREV